MTMSIPEWMIPPPQHRAMGEYYGSSFGDKGGEDVCGDGDVVRDGSNCAFERRQPAPVLVRPKALHAVPVLTEDRPIHTTVFVDAESRYEQEANWILDYGTMVLVDRASGAKNPCLEESEDLSDMDSSLSSWMEAADRKREEEYIAHLQQQHFSSEKLNEQHSFEQNPPEEITTTNVVRPIAIRIPRPQSVQRPGAWYNTDNDEEDDPIPRDIDRASYDGKFQREDTLSPLTTTSGTVASRSSHRTNPKDSRGYSVPLYYPKSKQDSVPELVAEEYSSSVSDDTTETDREVPADTIGSSTSSALFTDYSLTEASARDGILHALVCSGGETDSKQFKSCLETLTRHFRASRRDTRQDTSTEGLWLVLTKPSFPGCLGSNDKGDNLYSFGRMSFDMFAPTSLLCSLQGNFNFVERIPETMIPQELRSEFGKANSVMRTYNVVTAFTIEPSLAAFPSAINNDVRRPIRGIMTTFGYTLPDPDVPNRHTFWITGGRIEPNDDSKDQQAWKEHFDRHPPKHRLGEMAKLLAVKLLMGATIPTELDDDDGSMEYTFKRPVGGPGRAYIDVLYVSDTLRIVRGHTGTTYVFSRLPEHLNNEKPPHEQHPSIFSQNRDSSSKGTGFLYIK